MCGCVDADVFPLIVLNLRRIVLRLLAVAKSNDLRAPLPTQSPESKSVHQAVVQAFE